ASGFFVADTLEDPLGLEILFDISAPGVVEVSEGQLEISDADLLLAPELATALALPDLTGADVGDTRIDATVTPVDSGLNPLDTPFIRFQNSDVPGTYVYATGEEAANIRANLPGFVEEGLAFNAAIKPNDELIALSRLESNEIPGTFLYVGEEELNNINADPNFSNAFTNQGIAFYVYGVGANQETPFTRFQNSDVPGTYLYATGEEVVNIRDNFKSFIEEGIAFEAAI
ncbi:MAG: calcium-binding protein, partial [Xenococcus sp. MO_188.B8]|nr:calcium-binding protein [Xenococcus sp. MO_188.B8]